MMTRSAIYSLFPLPLLKDSGSFESWIIVTLSASAQATTASLSTSMLADPQFWWRLLMSLEEMWGRGSFAGFRSEHVR